MSAAGDDTECGWVAALATEGSGPAVSADRAATGDAIAGHDATIALIAWLPARAACAKASAFVLNQAVIIIVVI